MFFIALTLFFFAFVSVPVMESKSSTSSPLSFVDHFQTENFAAKSSALPSLDDTSTGTFFVRTLQKTN